MNNKEKVEHNIRHYKECEQHCKTCSIECFEECQYHIPTKQIKSRKD